MNANSAINVWKDFDYESLELDTVLLKEEDYESYTVRQYYFNGYKANDGISRVFARLYMPKSEKPLPLVVVAPHQQYDICRLELEKIYNIRDFAVLIYDYAGKSDEKPRFTLYPDSCYRANYLVYPEAISAVPEDTKTSCWYQWSVTSLRTITFALSLEGIDCEKIALVGMGLGSSQVWKQLAIDPRVKAGSIIFGSGYSRFDVDNTMDNETLQFMSNISSDSYCKYLCCPILAQTNANYINGETVRLSDMVSQCVFKNSSIYVNPYAHNSISPEMLANVEFWIRSQLLGGDTLPQIPTLLPKCHNGIFEYELTLDSLAKQKAVEVKLMYSAIESAPQNRCYQSIRLEKVSEFSYLATPPVFDSRQMVEAFAVVKYESGYTISSLVSSRVPKALGAENTCFKSSPLIYDSDMNIDTWLTDSVLKVDSVKMSSGALAIEGVTSDCGSLTTYKLSLPPYKLSEDKALQISVCSQTSKAIKLTLISKDNQNKAVRIDIMRDNLATDIWHKITINITDAKLISWNNLIGISVSGVGGGGVVVSSLLWV